MKVLFNNLNNNDIDHEIIFLNLTIYASGAEDITVLFDGTEYKTHVFFSDHGNRYFMHCGKSYDFKVIKNTIKF